MRYYPRLDIFGPISSIPGLHRLLPAPRCGLRSQGGRTQRRHRGRGVSTVDTDGFGHGNCGIFHGNFMGFFGFLMGIKPL